SHLGYLHAWSRSMKKTVAFLLTVLVLSCGMSLRAAENSATLKDCFESALKQSETLGITRQQVEESIARFQEARSGILPKLDFLSSDKWQDSSGNNGSQFTLPHTPERRF